MYVIDLCNIYGNLDDFIECIAHLKYSFNEILTYVVPLSHSLWNAQSLKHMYEDAYLAAILLVDRLLHAICNVLLYMWNLW